MATVLVTGGTGHLGSAVVDLLKPDHRVRVLARRPGTDPDVEWIRGDLSTGDGVARAVVDVDTVVHAATYSPAARRGYLTPKDFWRSPPDVDVDGTRLLLDVAAEAGVAHLLYVSIVGVDNPRLPYLRLKHTAEELVRVGDVPWTIVRATPFHWLLDRMLTKAAVLPVLVAPSESPAQPVAVRDVAEYLVSCVRSGPGQEREDIGGPEVLSLGDLIDQWQHVRAQRGVGRKRKVLRVPVPRPVSKAMADATCPTARRGAISWLEWLRENYPAS